MTDNGIDDSLGALLPLKPVDFLVLAVLQDGPRHGYGIVQEIAARTGGLVTVRPGDLYRVLYRMVRQGLVEPEADTDDADDDRRRDYFITELGRTVARAEADMLGRVIRDMKPGARRAGTAEA